MEKIIIEYVVWLVLFFFEGYQLFLFIKKKPVTVGMRNIDPEKEGLFLWGLVGLIHVAGFTVVSINIYQLI